VLSRAGGPGDKDDLVAAELDSEFIALDAPGAMRQRIRLHRLYFPTLGSVERGPLRAGWVIQGGGMNPARSDGMHDRHAGREFEHTGRVAVEAG
jgi:hypothetical protein